MSKLKNHTTFMYVNYTLYTHFNAFYVSEDYEV